MNKSSDSPIRNNMSHLLPYLSEGFCSRCTTLLETRLRNLNLNNHVNFGETSLSNVHNSDSSENFCSADSSSFWTPEKSYASSTNTSSVVGQNHSIDSSPSSVTSTRNSVGSRLPIRDEFSKLSVNGGNGRQSVDEKTQNQSEEQIRMSKVLRKKDFVCMEKVNGKQVNVLQGLELHTRVFNEEEQKKIVDQVYNLQRLGQSGKLRARTYTEPRKWMRGKGRVTIQFGCCYNYAEDKHGNPPGIIRDEEVDPIPTLFKTMIKRMVQWKVLPPSCIPNSCIVNIYDEGDCIPPHIDHDDFLRPFCTVSFLTESNILFGTSLKVVAPGEFSGSASIPLPVGSVLILNGNGADVAKHCVPAVRGKRISITFRKMDDSKVPFKFLPDPELQGLRPLGSSQVNKLPVQQASQQQNLQHLNRQPNNESEVVRKTSNVQFGASDFPALGSNDFPPLGGTNSGNRVRSKKNYG